MMLDRTTHMPTAGRNRKYAKHARRVRRGRRAAVVRGVPITARSLSSAAEMTGSCTRYVEAAAVLLQAEDPVLLADVLRGRVPLLAAAKRVKQRASLVTAYRCASTSDRVELARVVGPDVLFDVVVAAAV